MSDRNEARACADRVCPVCSGTPAPLGTRHGKLDAREYVYLRCPECGLTFVANPRADFEAIYTEDYYRGLGADPLVDYEYELKHPERTIRKYEWRGIVSIYQQLSPSGKWLDFGCGCGGLVAFALRMGIDIVGYDEGWGARAGRAAGIPILDENQLEHEAGLYDFVSAIEVIEHVADPLLVLSRIRRLLKPGGVLFLTTGNAEPWRDKLMRWGYLSAPEVHVCFFEPKTLQIAFSKAGLNAVDGSFLDGYVDIIKYKVLKILRLRDANGLLDLLPWRLISRVVDRRHRVTRQPYAVFDPRPGSQPGANPAKIQ